MNVELRAIGHQWLNLAMDILLMESEGRPIDVESITEAYDISRPQLQLILNSPEFQKQLGQVRDWLSKTSSDAPPMVIQSAIMATNLKEHMFKECLTGQVDFKEKLQFLQELNKDIPRAPQEEQQDNMGGANVINITLHSGIRGMGEFVGSTVSGSSSVMVDNYIDGEAERVDD